MLENEYLELVNQLQEKFNENEEKCIELKNLNYELKNDIISIAGLTRSIGRYYRNYYNEEDSNFCFLINELNDLCDGVIDAEVLTP